ncbi:ABC transporter permease [Nakamurella silvestris]|nr:ABC transporter permease [Nakamurella silvestris]
MTTTSPAGRGTWTRRAFWVLADGWTVAGRDLRHWIRQPGPVIIGWVFPVMILLMFAGLFGGAIDMPGGADPATYLDFVLPGMLALAMLFGLETTMIAVNSDAGKGVTDRFRSLPMSGSAVVLGRCVADMLHTVVGLAVLVGAGLALGWRWHNDLGSAGAAFGLLLLLRFAVLWIGVYIGLLARSPEALSPVQILIWPLGFLSNVFVRPESMPGWLGALATWNPLSATAAAARELFGNPGWGGDTWPAQHAVLMAVLWPLVIIAVFLPLSVRAYGALGDR